MKKVLFCLIGVLFLFSLGVCYSEELQEQKIDYDKLENEIKDVSMTMLTAQAKLRKLHKQILPYYISKLKDPNYFSTSTDGDNEKKWYKASEGLGQIGAPAIRPLIKLIQETKDDFERTQAFYALRLSAWTVKGNTDGDYMINKHEGMAYTLGFPPKEYHNELVKAWVEWFEKYQNRIPSY